MTTTVATARLPRQARREAILEAAARLFADQQHEAVTMSAVVTAAGVSRPVVYDHFPTRRSLIVALIERHHKRLTAALEFQVPVGGIRHRHEFRGALLTVFEEFGRDPAGWRLLCGEPSADPQVAEVQRRTRDEILDLTCRALGLAPSEKLVAEGVRTAANGLYGWHREQGGGSLDQLADAAVRLLWTGLHARRAGGNP
jgi:AcrR family transcriptional regulator